MIATITPQFSVSSHRNIYTEFTDAACSGNSRHYGIIFTIRIAASTESTTWFAGKRGKCFTKLDRSQQCMLSINFSLQPYGVNHQVDKVSILCVLHQYFNECLATVQYSTVQYSTVQYSTGLCALDKISRKNCHFIRNCHVHPIQS